MTQSTISVRILLDKVDSFTSCISRQESRQLQTLWSLHYGPVDQVKALRLTAGMTDVSPKLRDRLCSPPSHPVNTVGTGDSSHGVKAVGGEAAHAPPAEVKLYVLSLTWLQAVEFHQAQKQLYSLHTRIMTHDNKSVQWSGDNEIRIISS